MAEENKDNSEENNKKKKKTKAITDKINNLNGNPNISIGKIGRMNTITGKVEEVGLEDLSEEDLEKLNEVLGQIVKEISTEEPNIIDKLKSSSSITSTNKSKSTSSSLDRESLVIEKAQQDLKMNSHQVEKNRLFTLFDVITNTKELLIHRINEHGKVELQHNIAQSTEIAATNVIDLCLKQVFTWIQNNDINGLKSNFKPTDPDTLTKKSFLKKDE